MYRFNQIDGLIGLKMVLQACLGIKASLGYQYKCNPSYITQMSPLFYNTKKSIYKPKSIFRAQFIRVSIWLSGRLEGWPSLVSISVFLTESVRNNLA